MVKRFGLAILALLFLVGQSDACNFMGHLKQSTAVTKTVTMIDATTHVAGKTGLAAGITKYGFKAGGSSAALTMTTAEVDATNMPGVYTIAFTTAHTDTLGDLHLTLTASGADPLDLCYTVTPNLPGDGTITANQSVNVAQIGGQTATAGGAVTVGAYVGNATAAIVVDGSGNVTPTTASKTGYALSATGLDSVPYTATGAAALAKAYWADTTAGDFTVANSVGKSIMNGVALGTGISVDVASINGHSTSPVTTVKAVQGMDYALGWTTGANNYPRVDVINWNTATVATPATPGVPTVALSATGLDAVAYNSTGSQALAKGVWTDATAGDFNVSSSIGKSLYTSGNAPGAASGLPIVGSAMTLSGDLTTTMKGSVENAVLDADVSSHHTTSGTAGAKINAAGAASDPWAVTQPGAYSAGTFGYLLAHGVLLQSGTGTGQLLFTNGVVSSNPVQWNGTAVHTPGTAGVPDVNVYSYDGTVQTSAPAAVSDITTAMGSAAVGSVTGAVGSVTGNVGGNVTGSVGSVIGNVGGNVVGSVASVTGAVGSVTGAVGSVTGNIGGNVAGTVASVTGNVGGNVVGSVASVTGAVGSVTGAVGSVTGNVGGNVAGSVGSVATNGITSTSIATDAINAASVKADAVTKIQNGLATPTNITAGTITTVTNLTNAPTNGDFTTAQKGSIAAAAWDVAASGHNTGGTTGALLNAAGVAADPWTAALSGYATPGTAGYVLNNGVKVQVGTGSGQLNASGGKVPATVAAADVSGNPSVNAAQFGGQAVSLDANNLPSINLVDVGGAALTTHTSGLVPTDIRNIGGAAINTSSAQLGVNAVQLGGSAPGSATVGTVTTLTNLPAVTTNWLTAAGVAADAVTKVQSGMATTASILSTPGTPLNNDASGRVLLQPTQTGVTIPTVTTLTNLPAVTTDWLTAAGVKADAVTKINANTSAISKNTALAKWGIPMYKTDGTHAAASTVVTVVINIDNAGWALPTNSPSNVDAQGWSYIDWAAADLNGDVITVKATCGGCRPTEFTLRTR